MKKHSFKITVEKAEGGDKISFLTHNHDNIIDIIKQFNISSDAELSLILGMKLFGEAMLDDKSNPLYEEVFPAFGKFMRRFKMEKRN